MGPSAGIELFRMISSLANPKTDQGHPSIAILSYPESIPDRTEFLLGHGLVNPAYQIASVVHQLNACGSTVIGIPCNTSHAPPIYNLLQQLLLAQRDTATLIHMPFETCRHVQLEFPDIKKVGILSTTGTYRTRIYNEILTSLNMEAIDADPLMQESIIHPMIYDTENGIKSTSVKITNRCREWLETAIGHLEDLGAEAIILGCTELSLVKSYLQNARIPLVDSTAVLAETLYKHYMEAEIRPRSSCL